MTVLVVLPASAWTVARLGEHVEMLTGFPFKSARYSDSYNDIRLLRGDNVAQGVLRWDGAKRWPADETHSYSKYELKQGDVILAMDRPWIEAGLKYAWVRQSDLPCLLVQRVARLRGSATLNTAYLRYVIGSPNFTQYVKSITTGTAVPHISGGDIAAFTFPLPPPSTQRKIAAILSAYDDLTENNARRIALLEALARALYREWFVHFRFPGHEQVPLVASALGAIPVGWEVKTLGDLAQEVRRSVNPGEVDPETPYFGLEHLPRKSITLSEWGAARDVQSTKLAFKQGEILFGKIRPYFHKVGVAPIDGVCSSDTIVIAPKAPEHFSTVLCCVSSTEFVEHATQTSQGTKMPRADWKVLVEFPVISPPPALLVHFDGIVRDIVCHLHNLLFRNCNLRRTRDLLLPKLVSGEVDATNLAVQLGGDGE